MGPAHIYSLGAFVGDNYLSLRLSFDFSIGRLEANPSHFPSSNECIHFPPYFSYAPQRTIRSSILDISVLNTNNVQNPGQGAQ